MPHVQCKIQRLCIIVYMASSSQPEDPDDSADPDRFSSSWTFVNKNFVTKWFCQQTAYHYFNRAKEKLSTALSRGKTKTSLTFPLRPLKNDNWLKMIDLRRFSTTNVTNLSDMWHTSRPIQVSCIIWTAYILYYII